MRPRALSITSTTENTCVKCGHIVHFMDKIQADGAIYHKICMRCQECDCRLALGKYAAVNGQFYCKPHFTKLFKLKGNYDEGFGSVQHKNTNNWNGSEDA